jgi:hypothetical protein
MAMTTISRLILMFGHVFWGSIDNNKMEIMGQIREQQDMK